MREDIFIFAAEKSADVYGALLIKELKRLSPEISISGVFGPNMRCLEKNQFLPMEKFNIMGFTDILTSLPKLIKNFFYIRDHILKTNPKVCVFIDYPDFNLKLEKSLRKKGYKGKLIHYICPSIWAWRKKRKFCMEKSLDLLLTIFPFEKSHFNDTKLKVSYIGHPLLEKLRQHTYEEEWPYNPFLIGIFPGSRKKEIENNLPVQLESCFIISKKYPSFSFAISVSDKANKKIIVEIAKNYPKSFFDKLLFLSNQNYNLMNHLTLAIATSGTINLELALHNVPTIITYKIKKIDLFIAKNILKINLPYYCIVNILSNETIFPELYGPNLTKENLTYFLLKFLRETTFKETIKEKCKRIKKILQNDHASIAAAKKILKKIQNQTIHGKYNS